MLGATECWVLPHRLFFQDSGGRRVKEGEGLIPFPVTVMGRDWGKQQELYLLPLCLVRLCFRSCRPPAAGPAGRLSGQACRACCVWGYESAPGCSYSGNIRNKGSFGKRVGLVAKMKVSLVHLIHDSYCHRGESPHGPIPAFQ